MNITRSEIIKLIRPKTKHNKKRQKKFYIIFL